MSNWADQFLAKVETVDDMVTAFSDEDRCRRIFEALIWPDGRKRARLWIYAVKRPMRPLHGRAVQGKSGTVPWRHVRRAMVPENNSAMHSPSPLRLRYVAKPATVRTP